MLKAILSALTGIDDDIDSPEYQTSWERRRYIDENDLDDDDDCQSGDSQADDDGGDRKGWFGLW